MHHRSQKGAAYPALKNDVGACVFPAVLGGKMKIWDVSNERGKGFETPRRSDNIHEDCLRRCLRFDNQPFFPKCTRNFVAN